MLWKRIHDRENIMNVWEDYTIKDTIIVTDKAMKVTKPETENSCWKKNCVQMLCMTLQNLW